MKVKKLFKIFAGMIALLVMMQFAFTGCTVLESNQGTTASEQSAPTSQAASSSTTKETKASTDEFVKLTWYMRKPIDSIKDQAAVEEEINKTFREKINAELEFHLIDTASWEETMRLMSAAGEEHDLVFTSGWTNRLDINVQRGAFRPLDDLIDTYAPTIRQKADPRAWAATTYNGKIMAIPNQSPYAQAVSFVFKKDLVEKYNFDYKSVKSLKDLEPYLETIKNNEPGIIPLLATAKNPPPGADNFNAPALARGVVYNELTGEVDYHLTVPETYEIARVIHEYYKKGYIAKDAATKTDTMAEAKSGKYAVMKDNGGYSADGSKSSAIYGFPCVETLYGYPVITTSSMLSACTAISNTSKNPERAMMLLELVWSDRKLLNTMAYGIEGKNYTIVDRQGTDNPKVQAKTGAEQTWAIWHNWLGPLWEQWDSNWNSTAALEEMRANNENAKASATLGFIFDNEPIKTELALVNAAYEEITPITCTGVMADYDKFIEESMKKLKDAGIDKIKAEVERQLNEWKKANGK